MAIIRNMHLLLTAQLLVQCQASSSSGGPLSWQTSAHSVRSPEETEDVSSLPEETEDVSSFIFAGSDLRSAGSQPATGSTPLAQVSSVEAPPKLAEVEESAWEATFSLGVYESKKAVEAEDADVGAWVSDSEHSGSVAPAGMVKAEALLQIVESAPANRWKEKTAERALRLYYHAKWLAERNYARAAEQRYRESAELAKSCRRSVLASHSLARLGYFLLHWRRENEAAEVLQESMKLNTKSNPLAPYLHGVLERKGADGDVERLRKAEDAIMNSGEQPSEELELERSRLVEEISYWREAEGSSRHCTANSDSAYVLICFLGHAVTMLKRFF